MWQPGRQAPPRSPSGPAARADGWSGGKGFDSNRRRAPPYLHDLHQALPGGHQHGERAIWPGSSMTRPTMRTKRAGAHRATARRGSPRRGGRDRAERSPRSGQRPPWIIIGRGPSPSRVCLLTPVAGSVGRAVSVCQADAFEISDVVAAAMDATVEAAEGSTWSPWRPSRCSRRGALLRFASVARCELTASRVWWGFGRRLRSEGEGGAPWPRPRLGGGGGGSRLDPRTLPRLPLAVSPAPTGSRSSTGSSTGLRRGDPSSGSPSVVTERTRTWTIRAGDAGEGEGDQPSPETMVVGASAQERLGHKDFSELTPAEAAEVRSLIASMMWRPADTWSRRRRPARAGDRPDPRRTLRRMVSTEGDMMPAFTERRIRATPLSHLRHLVRWYSEMLL